MNSEVVAGQKSPTPTVTVNQCAFIAFSSNRDGKFAIFIMNINSKNAIRVTDPSVDSLSPTWSPDGRYIAYQSENKLYVFDLQNNTSHELTDALSGQANSVAWSPSGEHIAFASWRASDDGIDIYTIDPDGSSLRRISHDNGDIAGLSWSPDSKEIVYSIRLLRQTQYHLKIITVSDLHWRVLNVNDDPYNPVWSPDGRWIAFTSDKNDATNILRIDSSGSELRQLTRFEPKSSYDPSSPPHR